jgi:hypothetical protein
MKKLFKKLTGRIERIVLVIAMLGVIIGIQTSTVHATTNNLTQVFMGQADYPDGTTIYHALEGSHENLSSQSSFKCSSTLSCPGTLSNLKVSITVAPGANKTRTFTVQLNGIDTSLSVVISGASSLYAEDTIHTVTIAAGDRVRISEVRNSGTIGNCGSAWSTMFENNVNQTDSNIIGQGYNTSGPYYFPLQLTGPNRGDNTAYSVMPCSGTFKNMYVSTYCNTGTGSHPTITLYKNGSATNMTCTVSVSSGNLQTGNDTTHTVSVVAGDTVCYQSSSKGVMTFIMIMD